MSASQPTVVAVTAVPRHGGVGVIRLSGKNLLPLAQTLGDSKTPKPRTALYTDFLGGDGQLVGNGILLYFAAPASLTGEDVAKLQGHDGPVMMDMLLSYCFELGARTTQSGKFIKHTFLNNRLDPTQTESVADLIDASSKSAARMALRPLKGMFSRHIHELADDLITLRMLVEATLDFPEEDIGFLEAADTHGKFQTLQGCLKAVLASAERGTTLRGDMNVVLVGAPNVGKSNLLNALTGDDIAIVVDIAGTTRDTVRGQITPDGVPVHIIDTTDLRETDDVAGQVGIERSRKTVSKADVALVLIDPREGVNVKTQAILNSLPAGLKKIEIHSKTDLTGEPVAVRSGGFAQTGADAAISLSAKAGTGLNLLKHALLQKIGWQDGSESLFLTRSRHLNALHKAKAELESAALCDNNQIKLFAEYLRLAQSACSETAGEFTVDDLLGAIFSRFYVGK